MTTYCVREWLNGEESASTGSAVAFHGQARRGRLHEESTVMYLEIGDCYHKARLYKGYSDSEKDFARKVRLVERVCREFADFLESEYGIE